MAIELSTAGILLGYAKGDDADTVPSAFTQIPGAKSLPDLNPEPSTLETTPLDATEWKTYIDGLKDVGGALSITFNLTKDLMTKWAALMTDYKTAKADNKPMWFEFWIPGLDKSFMFTGNPSELGFGGAEVDSVLEISCYVTPTGHIGWQPNTGLKPTA